ncbi:MAG: hypothetical protein JNM34_01510 [Chthonomonadaceae bacterium]|nr:hypothetical protein [Chthonomonadaceae bacterium]
MKLLLFGLASVAFLCAGCSTLTTTLDRPESAVPSQPESSEQGTHRLFVYSKSVATPLLSVEAASVASKLDEHSLFAAEKLLASGLERKPDDAGLHAQMARYLALGNDLLDDKMDTKNRETLLSETFWNHCKTCVEFDPKWKPYVTHLVLGTVAQRAQEHIERNVGFSQTLNLKDGTDRYIPDHIGAMSYVYEATKFSFSDAAEWAPTYSAMADQMAQRGFLSSALWLANSAGDMVSGCVPGKDQEYSAKAMMTFVEGHALTDYSEQSSLKTALDLYERLYKENQAALNEETQDLLGALKEKIRQKVPYDANSWFYGTAFFTTY